LQQATLIGVLALKSAYDECYIVGLLMVKTAAYAIIMHEVRYCGDLDQCARLRAL
jgi:hypothetical protein